MLETKHSKFINTPITSVLQDAVTACKSIGDTIDSFPLCDYIMQSLFLKMTGFQEQKLKCICWDIATQDYTFRYEYLKNSYGECSNYKDKNKIFKAIQKQLKETYLLNDIFDENFKNKIFESTKNEINNIFNNSNLKSWGKKAFIFYEKYIEEINNTYFCCGDNSQQELLNQNKNLYKIYDFLYKHRNRCAHNLLSYQQNLPTLKTLNNKNYEYNNIFIYFFILILIDKIFIESYQKYLEKLEMDF